MANSYHREPPSVVHSGEVILTGKFSPNAANDPVAFDKSWMKSVSHDSTGNWTITLKDSFTQPFRLLGFEASGRDDAVADCYIRPGIYDLAAKTFKVEAIAAGAAANIAADADSYISVRIVLKNNKVNDGSEL